MKFNKFKKNLQKEYNDTFNEKQQKLDFSWFKKRYILYFLAVLFVGIIIGDHLYVQSYNEKVLAQKQEYINNYKGNTETINSLVKIESKAQLSSVRINEQFETYESLLDSIMNIQMIGCGAGKFDGDVMAPEANAPTDDNESMAPGASGDINSPNGGNSFETNIQTDGVDEADVSKCDGQYIYSLYGNMLIVFRVSDGLEVSRAALGSINNYELYIKDSSIIVVSNNYSYIYSFNGEKLELKNEFNFGSLCDSRLVGDYLYLVTSNNFNENEVEYDNLYYDGYCYISRVYSITKYNLSNNEYKTVENLNSGNIKLYASDKHFYLATEVYAYYRMTLVSIFDYDLNALGAVKVMGNINDQFSMDEYNGYFRIVHTDNTKEAERLNAISIYSLDTLKRVGYLDEGIGEGFQIIKSVSFKGDTCYCVTYQNTDPLYEIDCSNPENPVIVSAYKAPGYSSYLYTFEINGEKYLFGLGYLDSLIEYKISVYKDDEATTQIGSDYVFSEYVHSEVDYVLDNYFNEDVLYNHKTLFIYNDESNLYLGFKATEYDYLIFKIDVTQEEVITLYKEIKFEASYLDSRCYLVNGNIYITNCDKLYVEGWE